MMISDKVDAAFLAQKIAFFRNEKQTQRSDGWRIGKTGTGGSISVTQRGGKAIFHDFNGDIGGDVIDAYQLYGGYSKDMAVRTICGEIGIEYKEEETFSFAHENLLKADEILRSRGFDPQFVYKYSVGYIDEVLTKKFKGFCVSGKNLVFWDDTQTRYKIMPMECRHDGVWHRQTDGIYQGGGNLIFRASGKNSKIPIACEGEFDALTLALCGFTGISTKEKIDDIKYTIFDLDDAGDLFTAKYGGFDLRNAIRGIDGVKDLNDALLAIGVDELAKRIDAEITKAISKDSCVFLGKNSFSDGKKFLIEKSAFDSSTDEELDKILVNSYNLVGKCNGKIVVVDDGRLKAIYPDGLIRNTVFHCDDKKQVLKKLSRDARADIERELLYIYNSGDVPTIPIQPMIPNYPDHDAACEYADRLIALYDCFCDKKKKKSINQYMRVMGFILSGDYWSKKNHRFFINIVSKDTGIGKTNLFVKAMLRHVGLAFSAVPQKEFINQFSFSEYTKYDIICIDDITDENVNRLKPLLTNIVSNANFESEKKGVQAVQIKDYRALVICTGNKELVIQENTGLTKQKRLLVKFVRTKNQLDQDISVEASKLIMEAEQKPGIESEFLLRCLYAYHDDPDISDMLCGDTDTDKNERLFDLFRAVYKYEPVFNGKKLSMAKIFSDAVSMADRISAYKVNGKLDISKCQRDFAEIINQIHYNDDIGIDFVPASIYQQKIDGVVWYNTTRGVTAEKNCYIDENSWKQLQDWLNSINPIDADADQDDDDDDIADQDGLLDFSY